MGADVDAGDSHQNCHRDSSEPDSAINEDQTDGNGAGYHGVVTREREVVRARHE